MIGKTRKGIHAIIKIAKKASTKSSQAQKLVNNNINCGSKYLSQIKFKKLGNDGFSLAYSGLKSPIPNENNMG